MNNESEIRNKLLLEAAHNAWLAMAPIRERRRRYCNFTYGDQWCDITTDLKGTPCTERAEAESVGRKPMTNNLIRRLVKAVIGRYRMERLEKPEGFRKADPNGFNNLDELDARTLEEFLISGMAIHRVCREKRINGDGVWADNISPNRFFVNAFTDTRGCDLELVGSLLDMSMAEVLMRFAGGSARRAAQLKKLYGNVSSSQNIYNSPLDSSDISFFHTNNGKCRVIELWTLECRERLRCHDPLQATLFFLPASHTAQLRRRNAQRRRQHQPQIQSRWEVASLWHCRYLAPDGTELAGFDSPLADGSLPYAIKMYPLIDGEVHSLVEDVIDQQKYVNRLITLMDHIMGVSAKGALLFPKECKIDKFSVEQYAKMWSTPGAVIPYHPFDGNEPHQISSTPTDIGAKEMLQTQIGLFEDISGVNSTLMGKNISGAVGAERYQTEMRNSAVSILDLMETFSDFTSRRNRLMQQA